MVIKLAEARKRGTPAAMSMSSTPSKRAVCPTPDSDEHIHSETVFRARSSDSRADVPSFMYVPSRANTTNSSLTSWSQHELKGFEKVGLVLRSSFLTLFSTHLLP
jgi:hypothetical protein